MRAGERVGPFSKLHADLISGAASTHILLSLHSFGTPSASLQQRVLRHIVQFQTLAVKISIATRKRGAFWPCAIFQLGTLLRMRVAIV